jgi:hypothetical protein
MRTSAGEGMKLGVRAAGRRNLIESSGKKIRKKRVEMKRNVFII